MMTPRMPQPSAPNSLRRFFDRVVHRSFGDLALRDDPAADYVSDLLTRFARTETPHPPRAPPPPSLCRGSSGSAPSPPPPPATTSGGGGARPASSPSTTGRTPAPRRGSS